MMLSLYFIQRSKKWFFTGMIAVAGMLLLSDCSQHKNPLQTTNQQTAANFLVQAADHAEKTLKLQRGLGTYYLMQCIEQKTGSAGDLTAKQCEVFYRAILTYSKTQPTFTSLTKSDLTNKTVWAHLKSDVQSINFKSLP